MLNVSAFTNGTRRNGIRIKQKPHGYEHNFSKHNYSLHHAVLETKYTDNMESLNPLKQRIYSK